jgi:hypothetical protein
MQWRLSHAHGDPKNFPILSRQINVREMFSYIYIAFSLTIVVLSPQVVFDFMKVVWPFIDKKVKYFQIPHCFAFRYNRVSRRCYMMYKMYSSNPVWLPKVPDKLQVMEEFLTHHIQVLLNLYFVWFRLF